MLQNGSDIYFAIAGLALAGIALLYTSKAWLANRQKKRLQQQADARESEAFRNRIAPLLLIYEREVRATSRSIQSYVSLARSGDVEVADSSSWTFSPGAELAELLARIPGAEKDADSLREVSKQAAKIREKFKAPFPSGVTIPAGGGSFVELAAALDIHACAAVSALDKMSEHRLSPAKRATKR